MLFVALQLALAATVTHLPGKSLLANPLPGWTFVFACSSDSFDFPKLTRTFKRAAHLSFIDGANFVIVDTSLDDIQPSDLNVTTFPAIIFQNDGTSIRAQFRALDEEAMIGFMNTNAVSSPRTVSSEAELNRVFSDSSIALLCAVDGASDDKLPNIARFYRAHFHEVSVFYVKPTLLEKPGFWLYRYLDGNLVELADLTGKDDHEISLEIGQNTLPEFAKLNSMQAALQESLGQPFAILMLVMEDFYLTSEQLEFARELKRRTGCNVTYTDIENSQVASFRYGLPDSLDSTMAVIEPKDGHLYKYVLTEPLTIDNAEKLVKGVKAGTAVKYWKSEVESSAKGDGPQQITANMLVEMVRAKETFSLACYYGHLDQLEAYTNATQIVKEAVPKAKLGRMSLGLNDWPLEDFDGSVMPHLFVFVDGNKVFDGAIPETTEECAMKLTSALEGRLNHEEL